MANNDDTLDAKGSDEQEPVPRVATTTEHSDLDDHGLVSPITSLTHPRLTATSPTGIDFDPIEQDSATAGYATALPENPGGEIATAVDAPIGSKVSPSMEDDDFDTSQTDDGDTETSLESKVESPSDSLGPSDDPTSDAIDSYAAEESPDIEVPSYSNEDDADDEETFKGFDGHNADSTDEAILDDESVAGSHFSSDSDGEDGELEGGEGDDTADRSEVARQLSDHLLSRLEGVDDPHQARPKKKPETGWKSSPLRQRSITRDAGSITVVSPKSGTHVITDPRVIEEIDQRIADGEITISPIRRHLAAVLSVSDSSESALRDSETAITDVSEVENPSPSPKYPGTVQNSPHEIESSNSMQDIRDIARPATPGPGDRRVGEVGDDKQDGNSFDPESPIDEPKSRREAESGVLETPVFRRRDSAEHLSASRINIMNMVILPKIGNDNPPVDDPMQLWHFIQFQHGTASNLRQNLDIARNHIQRKKQSIRSCEDELEQTQKQLTICEESRRAQSKYNPESYAGMKREMELYKQAWETVREQKPYSLSIGATHREPWPATTRTQIADVMVQNVNRQHDNNDEPPAPLMRDDIIRFLDWGKGVHEIMEEIRNMGYKFNQREFLSTVLASGRIYNNYDLFAAFVFSEPPIAQEEFVSRLTALEDTFETISAQLQLSQNKKQRETGEGEASKDDEFDFDGTCAFRRHADLDARNRALQATNQRHVEKIKHYESELTKLNDWITTSNSETDTTEDSSSNADSGLGSSLEKSDSSPDDAPKKLKHLSDKSKIEILEASRRELWDALTGTTLELSKYKHIFKNETDRAKELNDILIEERAQNDKLEREIENLRRGGSKDIRTKPSLHEAREIAEGLDDDSDESTWPGDLEGELANDLEAIDAQDAAKKMKNFFEHQIQQAGAHINAQAIQLQFAQMELGWVKECLGVEEIFYNEAKKSGDLFGAVGLILDPPSEKLPYEDYLARDGLVESFVGETEEYNLYNEDICKRICNELCFELEDHIQTSLKLDEFTQAMQSCSADTVDDCLNRSCQGTKRALVRERLDHEKTKARLPYSLPSGSDKDGDKGSTKTPGLWRSMMQYWTVAESPARPLSDSSEDEDEDDFEDDSEDDSEDEDGDEDPCKDVKDALAAEHRSNMELSAQVQILDLALTQKAAAKEVIQGSGDPPSDDTDPCKHIKDELEAERDEHKKTRAELIRVQELDKGREVTEQAWKVQREKYENLYRQNHARLEDCQAEVQYWKNTTEDLKKEVSDFKAIARDAVQERKDIETAASNDDAKKDTEGLRAELNRAKEEIDNLTAQLATTQRERNLIEKEWKNCQTHLKRIMGLYENLENKYMQLQPEFNALQTKHNALVDAYHKVVKECEEERDAYDELLDDGRKLSDEALAIEKRFQDYEKHVKEQVILMDEEWDELEEEKERLEEENKQLREDLEKCKSSLQAVAAPPTDEDQE